MLKIRSWLFFPSFNVSRYYLASTVSMVNGPRENVRWRINGTRLHDGKLKTRAWHFQPCVPPSLPSWFITVPPRGHTWTAPRQSFVIIFFLYLSPWSMLEAIHFFFLFLPLNHKLATIRKSFALRYSGLRNERKKKEDKQRYFWVIFAAELRNRGRWDERVWEKFWPLCWASRIRHVTGSITVRHNVS